MFTQTASAGTITPTGANDGTYVLTLKDVSSQTVYFSDRPKGIAGHIPTSDIVIAWGTASEGLGELPLIAALQILGSGNKANFELSNPVYQPSERTLEYQAKIAPNGSVPPQLSVVQNTQANSLPEEFGQVTLFIDDSRQSTINHLIQKISISAINAIADEINKLIVELDQLKKDLS